MSIINKKVIDKLNEGLDHGVVANTQGIHGEDGEMCIQALINYCIGGDYLNDQPECSNHDISSIGIYLNDSIFNYRLYKCLFYNPKEASSLNERERRAEDLRHFSIAQLGSEETFSFTRRTEFTNGPFEVKFILSIIMLKCVATFLTQIDDSPLIDLKFSEMLISYTDKIIGFYAEACKYNDNENLIGKYLVIVDEFDQFINDNLLEDDSYSDSIDFLKYFVSFHLSKNIIENLKFRNKFKNISLVKSFSFSDVSGFDGHYGSIFDFFMSCEKIGRDNYYRAKYKVAKKFVLELVKFLVKCETKGSKYLPQIHTEINPEG